MTDPTPTRVASGSARLRSDQRTIRTMQISKVQAKTR
jgi:hypothetical protein